MTKHRDRNALSTTMTYDSLGRALTLTLADGRVTKYGYDPNGLFQTDSNAASIDTIKTDTAGLVMTEFTKQSAQPYTITSTSDVNGLLRRTVFKLNTTTWDSVTYGYDALMRFDTVRTKSGNTVLHYAADGLLTSWKLPTTTHDSMLVSYSQTHQPVTLGYYRAALGGFDESLGRDTLDRVVQQALGHVWEYERHRALLRVRFDRPPGRLRRLAVGGQLGVHARSARAGRRTLHAVGRLDLRLQVDLHLRLGEQPHGLRRGPHAGQSRDDLQWLHPDLRQCRATSRTNPRPASTSTTTGTASASSTV